MPVILEPIPKGITGPNILYGAAIASPSSTPSAAAIEAGTGAAATVSGTAGEVLKFSGLTPGAKYDGYFVPKSADGTYGAIAKVTFTAQVDGGATIGPAILIGAGVI